MRREKNDKSVSDYTEPMQNTDLDEDDIVIKSQFIKGIIAKLVRNAIQKKTQCAVGLNLNEIGVSVTGRKVHISLSADAVLDKSDLLKILNL